MEFAEQMCALGGSPVGFGRPELSRKGRCAEVKVIPPRGWCLPLRSMVCLPLAPRGTIWRPTERVGVAGVRRECETMIRFNHLFAAAIVGLLPLSVSQVSHAADDEDYDYDMDADQEDGGGEKVDDGEKAMNFDGSVSFDDDGDDDDDDDDEGSTVSDPASPYEKRGKTYLFPGIRYRGIVIPQGMMQLFGEGGTNLYVNSGGPELGIRKDDFEYVLSVWYANYKMSPVPFKGSGDPEDAWEVVRTRLKILYLTADLFWTSKLNDDFGLTYGFGGGLGIVWGDIWRRQAYPVDGGYTVCTGPDDPNGLIPVAGGGGIRDYCDEDNDHYGKYLEPSWFNGGSKPNFFPWLAGQAGIRYRPHEKIALRLDLGVGLSGPFFGLSAGYQL